MLSAHSEIGELGSVFLHGKVVRIFPHLDGAGLAGAQRWQKQLVDYGATRVDLFDLSGLQRRDGKPVNDLCDLTGIAQEQMQDDETLRFLLP